MCSLTFIENFMTYALGVFPLLGLIVVGMSDTPFSTTNRLGMSAQWRHFLAFLAKLACFFVAADAPEPGFSTFAAYPDTLMPAFLAFAVNSPT